MGFWVLLALQTGLTVVSSLLSSRSRSQVQPDTPEVPEVNDGDVIPICFGTVKLPIRPVDFSEGDWRTQQIRNGPRQYLGLAGPRPVVGYRYRASFVGLLCHGGNLSITDILIDNKSVADAGIQQVATVDQSTLPPTVTYSGTPGASFGTNITLFVPTLLGGDEAPNNGGVSGTIRFRSGDGVYNDIPELTARHSDVPSWRSFALLYFDDVYLGNSPVLPPLHAVVERFPKAPFGGLIGGAGDANPASILWELLTDPETGLALPQDVLDYTAFSNFSTLSGSATVGLSFSIETETSATKIIEDVLRTIDAVLITDELTGKLRPWPLRARDDANYGYTAGGAGLPQLTPANVESVTWTPPQPAAKINAVRVKFTDRDRKFRQNTVTATRHDLVAEMGQTVVQEVEFLGCSNEPMAIRLAERELRAQTTDLGRAVIRCNRSVSGVQPGKWVRLTWPEYDISERVLRVVDVALGTLDDPRVTITAVDDIYAVPPADVTVITTPPWVPSVPASGMIPPTSDVKTTQNATTGTVSMAVVDPQSRVTLVESRTYASRATPPAYVSAGVSTGYAFVATLSATDDTIVEWRITWTDDNGTAQQLEEGVRFARSAALAPPVLSVVWTDATTAVVTATAGDTTTLVGVRFASGTSAPSDATVIAATIDATAPYSVTVTVPDGEVRYLGAVSEATISGTTVRSVVARRDLTRGGGTAGGLTTRWEPVVTGDPMVEVQIVWNDEGDIVMAEVPNT